MKEIITLEEAVSDFLLEKKPTTATSYAGVLTRMVERLGPKRRIDNILVRDVDGYFSQNVRHEGYAVRTVRKHAGTIRNFFNWCVDTERLERSPARRLKAPPPEKKIDRDKAMSEGEFETVVRYVERRSIERPRDHALLLFMADSGCRPGEAASIQMKDLDLVKREAVVRGKTGTRTVTFGVQAGVALRTWLSRRPADKSPEHYLWNRHGKHIQSASISQIIRRNALAADSRSRGAYSLRHRKGHQLGHARTAPSLGAIIMGHSNPMTTIQNYYPDDWGSARIEADKLSYQPDRQDVEERRMLPFRGRDEETG